MWQHRTPYSRDEKKISCNLSYVCVRMCVCMCVQVKDFLSRFDTVPEMLELDHLTVSGDVTFGKNVSLKASATHGKGRGREGRSGRKEERGRDGEREWGRRYSVLLCALSFLPLNCREQSSSLPIMGTA